MVQLLSAAHLCWVRRPKLDWRAWNLSIENPSHKRTPAGVRFDSVRFGSFWFGSARTRTTLERQTQAVMLFAMRLLLVVSFNVLRQQHQRTRQQMTGSAAPFTHLPNFLPSFFHSFLLALALSIYLTLFFWWCVRASRLPSHPVTPITPPPSVITVPVYLATHCDSGWGGSICPARR